ncbi:MAG: serine hydroxymethyltransferase [Candidatus Bathyarchaeota archaeon]|nr:serine hydroxymethyltransferase [Candidatus Bathyarchaeota archaeon]MDH5787678.1 serine hydroxymethyltransferase [Candidatus Bathyarchaeota archaeon]
MPTGKDEYNNVFNLLQQHHRWFQKCIPLIASENTPSPAVREAIITDFGNRYAEGWPGERVYAGCRFIDQVEFKCIELMKRLFNAEFVDVRPISGVVANLVLYAAFTEPGDTMMALSIPCGGHITTGKKELGGTAGAVRGLVVEYLPLDYKELNIDVDRAKERISKLAADGRPPKLVMFGASVFPFPHPVKELTETIHAVNGTVGYDAAHVAGLIAGKQFQDPLKEGADVVSLSTHKTFFGPQHGGVLSWDKYSDKIKRATFPGMVSNHHLHAVAGVTIACAEMLEFGKEYTSQIVKNAKALGQALYERGFNVLAEHKGFTKSHVLLIDIIKHGDGGTIEETLEKANIIINRNLLPWDIKEGRHFMHPGGIRLGVSEITRLGMKESEMTEIAEFIRRAIMNKEPLEKVKADVEKFRKDYQKVHYCFENSTEAYKYIKIR